jgi:hypothetical protein
MRRIALAALAIVFLCLGAASTAVAQEEEPSNDTVQLAFWKCDWAEFQNFGQLVDSVYTPIAQELVNEGKLLYFQLLRHNWSDEWNFVFYYRTKDIPSFLDAWGELNSRIQERHPGYFEWFGAHCSDHKDGFYTIQTHTQVSSP